METVVHTGSQAQRDVTAITIMLNQRRVAEQVKQGVGETFGLKHLNAGNCAAGTDDAITGAAHYVGVGVDRACTVLQLASEAVVQAAEFGFARVRQIKVGKHFPGGNRQVTNQRLFELAEPAHEASQQLARNAVGEQKIEVFLEDYAGDEFAYRHGFVIWLG